MGIQGRTGDLHQRAEATGSDLETIMSFLII
jgi:hypothetical protein